ncbi:MAG: hypothetical protein IKG97_03790, partial [Lachnospiraceae bacterium]|nr:hypothetical protein [Lachnospiraceae bacterium]
VIITLIIYFAGFSKLFKDIMSRRKARLQAAPQASMSEKAAVKAEESVKETSVPPVSETSGKEGDK